MNFKIHIEKENYILKLLNLKIKNERDKIENPINIIAKNEKGISHLPKIE
jgi:hypothetical protein